MSKYLFVSILLITPLLAFTTVIGRYGLLNRLPLFVGVVIAFGVVVYLAELLHKK